jgi:hypothetical protein
MQMYIGGKKLRQGTVEMKPAMAEGNFNKTNCSDRFPGSSKKRMARSVPAQRRMAVDTTIEVICAAAKFFEGPQSTLGGGERVRSGRKRLCGVGSDLGPQAYRTVTLRQKKFPHPA